MFLGQTIEKKVCKSKLDAGFILDSSGSLRANYGKEKDFIKSLASALGLSADGARAGVVTFSNNAVLSIRLKDHIDISAFNNAVDSIPFIGSGTRIDVGLRLAERQLFTIANGGRLGVPKILILLTDGSQTQASGAEDPSSVANEIRNKGIKLLVIGIGSGTNQAELLRLGDNKADNVFNAANFDELLTAPFISAVSESSCNVGMLLLISS